MSGSYESPYGEIRSGWEVVEEGRTLVYEPAVPANSEATLSLPATSADTVREERTPLARVPGGRPSRTGSAHTVCRPDGTG